MSSMPDVPLDDGGPAFPIPHDVSQNLSTGETTVHETMFPGMSLRDFFAAHAIVGYRDASLMTYEDDARSAYRLADAMLFIRKLANP